MIKDLGVLFFVLFMIGCTNPKEEQNSVEQESPARSPALECGTWIYFSQNTFPGNDVGKGMSTPNVQRKLNATEEKILDSLINLPIIPLDSGMSHPVTGCYWPKHALVIISSSGVRSAVNICFECDKTRSSDAGLSRITIEQWSYFFSLMKWPVKAGYQEFFTNARYDSAFRERTGSFRF
jgi:hypothetical protein